jgi:hypothetical protein
MRNAGMGSGNDSGTEILRKTTVDDPENAECPGSLLFGGVVRVNPLIKHGSECNVRTVSLPSAGLSENFSYEKSSEHQANPNTAEGVA